MIERGLAAPGCAPVYETLGVGVPSPWNHDKFPFVEVGRVVGTTIGLREAGDATWTENTMERVAAQGILPEHLDPDGPKAEDVYALVDAETRFKQGRRYGGSRTALGWTLASDAWLARTWARVAGRIVQRLAAASSLYGCNLKFRCNLLSAARDGQAEAS